jgi:hypothetical protein
MCEALEHFSSEKADGEWLTVFGIKPARLKIRKLNGCFLEQWLEIHAVKRMRFCHGKRRRTKIVTAA